VAITANIRSLTRLAYGLYAWLALLIVIVPVLTGLLLIPGVDRRRGVARWGAAAVLTLMGSRVHVHGDTGHLDNRPVVVANHASYLDGIILMAVLPPEYTFLIKREMNRVPIAGWVLRRIGSQFVDRADTAHRHRTGRRLIAAALEGMAIAVFPEGTFDEQPGLKPFHSGAFRAALRAHLPVLPVVISGARAKLPGDHRLPLPGPLAVTICDPIPAGSARDIDELMQLTRDRILEWLGEPDLDPLPDRAAAS
jgi:1-acyl-sn-glycerol-3-phosphate acyltransferase